MAAFGCLEYSKSDQNAVLPNIDFQAGCATLEVIQTNAYGQFWRYPHGRF